MADLSHDTLFKALDGVNPVNGGDGRYPGVGRWTRHLDPDRLEPCRYGFHLARGPQVLEWLAPTLYVAEACPDHSPVEAGGKVVTCRVRLVERLDRWDETTARLFAADCAEAALLGERACGREPDERSWLAVEAARRFARGEIGRAELSDARYAAEYAAGYAARYATESAAWSAAGSAAWYAARSAAWYAAGYAAAVYAAARDAAARDAARRTQFDRLVLYLTGADLPPVEALYGKVA